MAISVIGIREPEIALVTAGTLTRLWRAGVTAGHLRQGDLLWVREPFYLHRRFANLAPSVALAKGARPVFATDLHDESPLWADFHGGRREARTMPRLWHRQHLRVERTERRRIQTITEAEARAQGYNSLPHFARAWDQGAMFSGHDVKWANNPWATLVTFTRIEGTLP